MKRTIERITRAAMLAVAFMLCATGQAWAVAKPLAVWNGDFPTTGTSKRGDFTLDLGGNASDGEKVTIKGSGTATSGVKLSTTSTAYHNITVIVGVNFNGTTPSGKFLFTTQTERSGGANLTGVFVNSGKFDGSWQTGTSTTYGSKKISCPTDDKVHYMGILFAQSTSASGTKAFMDGTTCVVHSDKLADSQGDHIIGISICGLSDGATKNFENAVISYIAVFAGAENTFAGAVGDEESIAAWSLGSMTKVGTTLASADDNTGVNLATADTLSGEVSAAAVFVQESATLSVGSSSKLNIGDGEGPLYIAVDETLTIDLGSATMPTAEDPYVVLINGKVFGNVEFSNLPSSVLVSRGDGENIGLVYAKKYYDKWADNEQKVIAWRQTSDADFHTSSIAVVTPSTGAIGETKAMNDTDNYHWDQSGTFSNQDKGAAIVYDNPSMVGKGAVKFQYFTPGGLLVIVPGGSLYGDGNNRQLKLGNPNSAGAASWYVLARSFNISPFVFNNDGTFYPNYIYREVHVQTFEGAVLTLPASGIVLWDNANLVMHGDGKIKTRGILTATQQDNKGQTLDYSNLAPDSEDAFIDATLAIDNTTIFKFPDNAVFPYPVAKTVTGAPTEGNMTFYVGGTQYTRPLTFEDGKACPGGESIATFAGGNAGTWAGLTWDLNLPDTSTRRVRVTETGTIDLGSVSGYPKVIFDVDSNKTLTLTGTLTADEIEFTGSGTVNCSAANTLQGTIKGGADITIAYPSKVLPVIAETGVAGTTWTDSAWRGTILLRDCGAEVAAPTQDDVLFELYGNENSKIRAPGFKGHWAKEASICEAELYLAEGDVVEFNHGTSEIVGTTDVGFRFAKLSGTGKLRLDGTSDKAQYIFEDVSGFAGSVEITNPNPYAAVGGKKSFVFGASRETDVQGSEYAANLVIAGNVTVPAGKTWDTPAGVIIWSGATLTLGDGSTISGISPKSSGTLTVANGSDAYHKNSATINSIIGTSIAETVTITIPEFATLNVSDTEDISGKVKGTDAGAEAKITALTLPADSTVSTGNYFNSGMLDLSGCTALTTLTLKLGQSKEFDLAKVSLPGTCTTLIYDIGGVRNLTGYTAPDWTGEGKTFYYLVDENATEYGSGSITITNVPSDAAVKVNGMGNIGVLATTPSGSTRTGTHTPGVSGSGCWHDWEFDNSLDDADTAHADTKIAMFGGESNMYQQDGATANYFVKLDTAKPYPSSAPGLTAPWSAAIRCTMPGQDKVAIAFGSNANGAVALVSGEITTEEIESQQVEVAGVVRLVNWTGSELKMLAKLVVERSTTAQHVYAFSFREETVEAVLHRYVAFYRDGEFIHEAEYSVSSAITNFKLGTIDEGCTDTGLSDATSGLVDYVRLYNSALSTAMAEALAAENPFVSDIPTYTRELVSGPYSWSTADAWTKTSDGSTDGSPAEGAHATLTSSAESTVSINLGANTAYGTMILAGEGAITLTQGATGKISAQTLVVRTPVTVAYNAVDFSNSMVGVDPGASLTFDFSDYPFGTITSVSSPETVYLTGEVVATEYDNTVGSRIRVTGTPEHTWTVSNPAYDSENKHFYVTITPDHTAGAEIYYKSGYITAGMDGDGGTNIGTVFNNAGLTAKTTLFAGDTVVVSDSSALTSDNAWISDTFNGNLKVTRTTLNLMPGESNQILNNRTITVESGSTLNLKKQDTNNGPRTFSFGSLTLKGAGKINFANTAEIATLNYNSSTDAQDITVANGATLTVTTLALPAETPVTVGSLLLKVSGKGTVNLSGVTVGGTPTPLKWVRKTVDGIDGIYVISGTIFSVW